MAFPWPIDKLTLINSALVTTADNLVATADNGSDEWNVASPAYDRGLAYATEGGDWGYASQIKVLQPSPTPPQDTSWDTAYSIPSDCIHIIWVKIAETSTSSTSNLTQPSLTLYDIQGTPTGPVIVVNAQGGPPPPPTPVTPAQITLKYISNAGAMTDSTSGTPTLILALQSFVMSGIYRGLHEDTAEADKLWLAGEQMLQRARALYAQQKPKRYMWNSRMAASRRIRRPWPPVGLGNWGGSNGTPG